MEAIIQEIDVEALTPIFNIPQRMRNTRVEVIIRPIEEKPNRAVAERIERFRKKHNRETFAGHLKAGVSQGLTFDFDVQKAIEGTETEEEKQARYRLEKQTWGRRKQLGGIRHTASKADPRRKFAQLEKATST